MLREVKAAQRKVRVLAIGVDGTGTAALGEGSLDATLADSGTGDYLITFNEAFLRAPCVFVQTKTTNSYAQLGTVAVGSVQILIKNLDDDTALDGDFDVLVWGFDAADAV